MITPANRRFASFVLLGFLASTTPCRADDVEARVKHALERDQLSELAAAPQSEKAALCAELRKYRRADRTFSQHTTEALIQLGDSETIEHYLQMFNGGRNMREWRDAARMLRMANQPSVIARVAGQLLKEESAQQLLDGDMLTSPKSVLAAQIIVDVGAHAAELPRSVREALQKIPSYPPENLRAAVRQWWTANRRALESRKYNRVLPTQ